MHPQKYSDTSDSRYLAMPAILTLATYGSGGPDNTFERAGEFLRFSGRLIQSDVFGTREHSPYVIEARLSGATSLRVVGNPHAEGFYRKCGFRILGEKKMQFGVGLLMTRDLV